MLNLFTDEVRRDPFPLYDQIRSVSPLYHVPIPGIWLLFDYQGVKRAMDDHESFSSAATPPGSGGEPLQWLIFYDPPRQAKLRGLISRAFTPRMISGLEPRIRELSRTLLNGVIERGEMDLALDFSIPLPLMVIADMIGIPPEDQSLFKQWSDVMLGLSDTIAGNPDEAVRAAGAFRAASAEMGVYLQNLAQRRRASPENDLLTRLVEAEVDGEKLTESEILGFFQLLLLAGNETTTNLINSAILCFFEHPDQLARVVAEPGLLPSAIEEVLRYRSPLQMMFRKSTRNVEINGQTIPAGEFVMPVIGSANRDAAQFSDPDHFDIGRNPNPHLAFGHGVHFCLGAPLARLEAWIALGDILERVKEIRLASDEPWEPRKAFHVHGPTRLPIRFLPGLPVNQ